jgi:hypothetical protein
MKQLILFAFISFYLLSCSSPADKAPEAVGPAAHDSSTAVAQTPPADKTKEENMAVVNKYLSAIENHDTVTMASLMADNYKGYGPSIGDSASKQENLENWKYNLDHYFATIKYNRYQNFATTVTNENGGEPGNWVSNWAYCEIKYKDGKGPIHLWVNSVYKIENGKIAKSRIFYNEADWLRQLGYRFVKPPTRQKGQSL